MCDLWEIYQAKWNDKSQKHLNAISHYLFLHSLTETESFILLLSNFLVSSSCKFLWLTIEVLPFLKSSTLIFLSDRRLWFSISLEGFKIGLAFECEQLKLTLLTQLEPGAPRVLGLGFGFGLIKLTLLWGPETGGTRVLGLGLGFGFIKLMLLWGPEYWAESWWDEPGLQWGSDLDLLWPKPGVLGLGFGFGLLVSFGFAKSWADSHCGGRRGRGFR